MCIEKLCQERVLGKLYTDMLNLFNREELSIQTITKNIIGFQNRFFEKKRKKAFIGFTGKMFYE